MSLIEIAGFPRSGKTTIVKRVLEANPEFVLHPDLLEIVPPGYLETTDSETVNFWYAQYCVERQRRLLNGDSNVNIMERGILDRIAYGKASVMAGRMNPARFPEYLEMLTPLEHTNDQTILFLTSPETSFARIRSPKKSPTQYLEFLRILHQSYQELLTLHPEIIVIPSNISPEEQFSMVLDQLALTDPFQGILS